MALNLRQRRFLDDPVRTPKKRKRKRVKERRPPQAPPEEHPGFAGDPERELARRAAEAQPGQEEEEQGQVVARAVRRVPVTAQPGSGPPAPLPEPLTEQDRLADAMAKQEQEQTRLGLAPRQRFEGDEEAMARARQAIASRQDLPPGGRFAGPKVSGEGAALMRRGRTPTTDFGLRIMRAAFDAGERGPGKPLSRPLREINESSARYRRQAGIETDAKAFQQQEDAAGRFVTNKTATEMAESAVKVREAAESVVEAREQDRLFREAGDQAFTDLATGVAGDPDAAEILQTASQELGEGNFGLVATDAQRQIAIEAQEAGRARREAGASEVVQKARQRIADKYGEDVRGPDGELLATPSKESVRTREKAMSLRRATDAAAVHSQRVQDAERAANREFRRQTNRLDQMARQVSTGEISRDELQVALGAHRSWVTVQQRTIANLRSIADREDRQLEARNTARTKVTGDASIASAKANAKATKDLKKMLDEKADKEHTERLKRERDDRVIKERKAAATLADERGRQATAKAKAEVEARKPNIITHAALKLAQTKLLNKIEREEKKVDRTEQALREAEGVDDNDAAIKVAQKSFDDAKGDLEQSRKQHDEELLTRFEILEAVPKATIKQVNALKPIVLKLRAAGENIAIAAFGRKPVAAYQAPFDENGEIITAQLVKGRYYIDAQGKARVWNGEKFIPGSK